MAVNLDKCYTKASVADYCLSVLYDKIDIQDTDVFLEPSAGDGSFIKSKKLVNRFEAYDIAPEAQDIQQLDYYKFSSGFKDYIIIGNPPFGKRSKMAIDFFNISANYGKVIGFILPITFMKWGVQSKLNKRFKLIYNEILPSDSFLVNGEDYSIRTVFQIWVREDIPGNDLRRIKAPAISHPDFQIWQHNATEQSRKVLDEDWEIAVWRQGYKDYNEIFTRSDYEYLRDIVYNTNLQLFFIKPHNARARELILRMDFNDLATRNMSTPGFGKADFVEYYEEIFTINT